MPLSASQDVCPPSRGLKSSIATANNLNSFWWAICFNIFPCLIIFCLFCVKVLQSVPQLSSENRILSAWKLTERGAFGFFKCVWPLRWRRQTWWNSSAIGGIDELIVLGGSILMSDAKSFRSPNHHSRRGIHNVLVVWSFVHFVWSKESTATDLQKMPDLTNPLLGGYQKGHCSTWISLLQLQPKGSHLSRSHMPLEVYIGIVTENLNWTSMHAALWMLMRGYPAMYK